MSQLTTNDIAFIGLCNEFCRTVEGASESEPAAFVASMTRLLPRIYISASDLTAASILEEEQYIPGQMDEAYYDSTVEALRTIFGADDTYLEVFEEDMKYSDTPVGASIAEQVADLFQVLYNFIEYCREGDTDLVAAALAAVSEDFRTYWGQILCNVMRPLNQLRYSDNFDNSTDEIL